MSQPWYNFRSAGSSLKGGGFSLKTVDASNTSKRVSGTSELNSAITSALSKPQKSIKTSYLEVDTQVTCDCPVSITGDSYLQKTTIIGDLDVTGNVIVRDGNLLVIGSSVDLQMESMTVKDNNIELNTRPDADDSNADGGGIIVHGTSNKSWTYDWTAPAWFSSENIYLPPYKAFYLGHPGDDNSWRIIAGQNTEAGQLFIQKRQGGTWRTSFAFS